ncbi:MAG TPA: energy transducer TonB [Ignavibacteriaceae bacterium]|nr:energy transducer TonB [Ignavibacteriaceae bacterium]
MVNESTFNTDFNELVFASRNKEYGSYRLRKSYKFYLTVAMWISIFLIVVATVGSTINKIVNPEEVIIKNTEEPVITLQPPPSLEQIKKDIIVTLPPLKPTIKFIVPVVKPDALVHNEIIPTVDELLNANPDVETVEGVEGGYDKTLTFVEEEVVKEEIKTEIIFQTYSDILPEPIGGIKGIQEKINYPVIAIKAGVEGRVIVRAFVDESGTVAKAEIIKGIGAGCDEAALKAVVMTKFNPGKQRGIPVKVQVSIPVVFKLK